MLHISVAAGVDRAADREHSDQQQRPGGGRGHQPGQEHPAPSGHAAEERHHRPVEHGGDDLPHRAADEAEDRLDQRHPRRSSRSTSARTASRAPASLQGLQLRENLLLVELEEALLVPADLMDADVVVARGGVLADRGEMLGGILLTGIGVGLTLPTLVATGSASSSRKTGSCPG